MNDENVNVLKSDEIKIEKNVIEMDNAIIQISNVTSVALRLPPKFANSNAVIIGLIIGALLLFSGTQLAIIGIVLVGVCGFCVYKVHEKNQGLGKNIIISTGAGQQFWINSKNDGFSLKVIDVIKNLMNDPNKNTKVVVELDKMNILNNGNLVYGNVKNSILNKDGNAYKDVHDSIIGNDNSVSNNGDKSDSNDGVRESDIPELRI